MRTPKKFTSRLIFFILLPIFVMTLSACDAGSVQTLNSTIETAKTFKNRAAEYAAKAPEAPYDAQGDLEVFSAGADDNGLLLTGEQLGLINGASDVMGVNPVTLATIVELEIRHLDPGELDRDVLSALTGDNTSIGIAQVRLSTAEEIEQQDTTGLLPEYDPAETQRSERIRRLAADDWSVLYAAGYLKILHTRFPGDDGLSLGQRYTGATPAEPSQESRDLRNIFKDLLN